VPRPARAASRNWTRYSDERLLQCRLRELNLRLQGTWLQSCVNRLYEELENRGILFRPHVWLSTEWFSPDGIPGIAIPFYLAHPRLMKLERRQMLQVEGGTEAASMRILRHEAGHAMDSAYRLHFKPAWRKTFGSYAQRYPDTYIPKPNSRSYVLHLDSWYAQAHPAEDFAETFAVWLKPRSAWRQRYRDWPKVLRKLRYVEREIIASVAGQPPKVRSRRQADPIVRSSQTLGDYYEKKRARYHAPGPEFYDRDLYRLFSADPRHRGRPTAGSFLRSIRTDLRESVAEWTGVHPYTIDQVLQDMIDRARQLRLRLAVSPRKAKTQAVLLLTVHTMNCLYVGRYEIPL
jgi:hypothetical protein